MPGVPDSNPRRGFLIIAQCKSRERSEDETQLWEERSTVIARPKDVLEAVAS